jgi:hypothetical protein
MLSLIRRFAPIALLAHLALAQPALTTIQDTLYRADGSRFSGTIFIRWSSFQAGDSSNIATSNLALPIVNGALRVRLAPTTTASAGAQYNITYNSDGVNQFTEVWAVPPSSVTLRVRDVRVSTGTIVGPAPVTSPIQISDVTGLQNELAVRPMKGVGFGIGRTAVINQAGQIEAASGNLGDCVRVDGSSGPCGGGGGVLPNFSDGEVPVGVVNGINTGFTLALAPSPAASLELYRNGLRMEAGTDYQLTGNAISFFVAAAPQTGDLLLANYRYGNPNNPLGSLTAAQVICSSAGLSTAATALTSLGTCTAPAGLLASGDRLEIQFQYAHVGSAVGFSGQVNVGSTAVFARSAAALESALAGRSTFGIYTGGQQWDTQSWGATTVSFQAGAGIASENTAQPLTVNFFGQMASAGTDTLVLRNFTVIRYPAQSNP